MTDESKKVLELLKDPRNLLVMEVQNGYCGDPDTVVLAKTGLAWFCRSHPYMDEECCRGDVEYYENRLDALWTGSQTSAYVIDGEDFDILCDAILQKEELGTILHALRVRYTPGQYLEIGCCTFSNWERRKLVKAIRANFGKEI